MLYQHQRVLQDDIKEGKSKARPPKTAAETSTNWLMGSVDKSHLDSKFEPCSKPVMHGQHGRFMNTAGFDNKRTRVRSLSTMEASEPRDPKKFTESLQNRSIDVPVINRSLP